MRLLRLWWLLPTFLCACQSHHSAMIDQDENPDPNASHYIVTGDVIEPGRHVLNPGETISMVLASDLFHSHGVAVTVVLRRQGPEGKTRELIQLNPDGKLMDEKQDYVLRDGDELIFPTSH
jgi:protein involved in polysaccharide export with SLBB domain